MNRLSDLMLERYHLGELTEAQRRAVEDQLKADPEARARLAALGESDAEILAAHPPPVVVPAIRRRAERQVRQEAPTWTRGLFVGAPVLAAAAAALVFAVTPTSPDVPDPLGIGPDVTRPKGLLPSLHVYRRAGDEAERLSDGAVAQAHDVLQLSYVAVGRPHGVILSVDGRGAITLHHPEGARGDTSLLPAGEAALPHSYELDDAPAFERFFFVTSREGEVDVGRVLGAAERLARAPKNAAREPLNLPPGLEQTTFLLRKAEGR
jgi:hypothetical protein